MPGKDSSRATRPRTRSGGRATTLILLLAAAAILAVLLRIPEGLWRQPGFADLRDALTGVSGPAAPEPMPTRGVPSAAWYHIYFTAPRYPDRQSDHHDGIDQYLVQLVAGAQHNVDVAAYQLDLDTVADALLQARGRGATVRLVTDTDNIGEKAVQRLQQGGVPVVGDKRSAIMHDKFVIVDGRYVWTGSYNLTVNCTYRNNNNAILIDSPELARNYEAEFGEMFEQQEFGPRSPSNTVSPEITLADGTLIENYFAPEDHVESHIAAVLSQAQQSIRFLAFSFTDGRLAGVLIERARAGVAVSGVIESRGATEGHGQLDPLRKAGIDVLPDGNPYVMHHKVLIVDDQIVVTGSFNFTESADKDNDENVLIIHNRDIAKAYLAEFERVRQRAASPENP